METGGRFPAPRVRREAVSQVVDENSPFATETHVLGDPRDERTGFYYVRPRGEPVIKYLLGDGIRPPALLRSNSATDQR